MENKTTETDQFFSPEKLPQKKLRVMVVCKGFRCLGYLDAEGVWRSAYSKERLENVLGWYSAD